MRKRPFLLIAAGLVALVAGLAVFQTVGAQTPQGGVYPTNPVRSADWLPPPAQPLGQSGNRTANYQPQPQGKGAVVQQGIGQPARPRLSTAVVAGADGVRPAAAWDLTPPPPDMQGFGAAAAAPQPIQQPPVVSQDMGAAPATLPIPTPPVPTAGPAVQPSPPPVGVSLPVMPITQPNTPAVAPQVSPVQPQRQPQPQPEVTQPSPEPLATPVTRSAAATAGKVMQTVTLEAVSPETVVFGSDFRYELIVKNAGTVPVGAVRVEDELPAGAKFVGSEPPAELNADRLSWALGVLEAGAEKRIVVRVKPVEEGDLRSRAVVSYSAAVEARTKVTRPRIGVVIAGPEVAKAGDEPTFQIKVTNTGTGPAQGMVLQAFLSEGLVHPAGAKLEIKDLPLLPPGDSKIIPLKVNAGKAGPQWCQVVVAAPGSQDATAKASLNVLEPLLQIAHTGPAKCLVRAEPVYEITLSNPGTAATDPVNLYAVVPEGFEYVQASDNATFTAANRAVVWKIPGLAPGGSKPFTLKLRAMAESDGMLRLVAQAVPEQAPQGIAAAGGAVRPAAGRVLEAKAETAIKADGIAAVRFDVLDLDDPVEVGKEATYEVRVMNQGTGACSNVQLVAAMADGCTFTGSTGPTQVKAQGQTLVFDPIQNLGVKGEAVYRVKVRGASAGDIRFRVQLTCDQVRNPVVKEESTRFVKP